MGAVTTLFLLILTVFQNDLFSSAEITELKHKEMFLDYIPQHLDNAFVGGVVFKQQKYDEMGNLKQVDSIALKFKSKEKTALPADKLIHFDRKTYGKFRDFLNDTHISIRFKHLKENGLPFITTEECLYDDEMFENVETLSYERLISGKLIHIMRSAYNAGRVKDAIIEGLIYNEGGLVKNITMKIDTLDRKGVSVIGIRKISLRQYLAILSIFDEATSLYDKEIDIAKLVADSLDLIYPKYDWAVVIDPEDYEMATKDDAKYVTLSYDENIYTIYNLPTIRNV